METLTENGGSLGAQVRRSKIAKIIGDRGENIVLKYEKEKLESLGQKHLVTKIVHEAGNNNTPGWDITSFDENGEEIYIEVKATVGGKISTFTLTANELAAARNPEYRERYYIYLVFEAMSPKGARIEIIKNPYSMIKNSELRISLESVSIGL